MRPWRKIPISGAAGRCARAFWSRRRTKAYAEETERSLRAGAAAKLNNRERAHLEAARDWAEGRFHEGAARYARIARENPRELAALQYAHVACFFLSMQQELRDWPLQALGAFRSSDDGYSYILGMAAFGLEECGGYARAEIYGKQAVAAYPRDGWAVHAVAHVNEMRGDLDAGIPWLADSAKHWPPDSGFAYNNRWRLALLHLDRGDIAPVLELYDEKVRPDPNAQIMLEWIDAAALLWRLYLEGVDTGDRFAKVANAMERCAEAGIHVFNGLHAIMAFLGAGRSSGVERTLKAMRRVATGEGDNAYLARVIGLPLSEAFVAYAAGDYKTCVEKTCATRGVAQRFGGSHAQCDILTLTALHAAIRGRMREAAEALAAERLAYKPHSPWAGRLAPRDERSLARSLRRTGGRSPTRAPGRRFIVS